jgi:CRP/FNR family nitrogen fixation transcriptional regulator
MGRRDIADYLGLTIKTVSRAPCELCTNGVVKFLDAAQRAVVIPDRQRLAAFDR